MQRQKWKKDWKKMWRQRWTIDGRDNEGSGGKERKRNEKGKYLEVKKGGK